VTDDLSEAEREYRDALNRRRAWSATQNARHGRLKAEARAVVREALPNLVGTVGGAAIIYLVALAAGAIQGAPLATVASLVGVVTGAVAAAVAAYHTPPGPSPEVLERMRLAALVSRYERLWPEIAPERDDRRQH
jgi:hypothetical protein